MAAGNTACIPRCHAMLNKAGRGGLKLKRTGVRWYGGHTVGRFEGTEVWAGLLTVSERNTCGGGGLLRNRGSRPHLISPTPSAPCLTTEADQPLRARANKRRPALPT